MVMPESHKLSDDKIALFYFLREIGIHFGHAILADLFGRVDSFCLQFMRYLEHADLPINVEDAAKNPGVPFHRLHACCFSFASTTYLIGIVSVQHYDYGRMKHWSDGVLVKAALHCSIKLLPDP